jgi:3'(2'), 5'-bisphosphate nucleotidase
VGGTIEETLLREAATIAERAGAVILEYYAAGATARTKADSSPVTDADEAAEALIRPALEALLPGVPVVAEEAMARGEEPTVANGRFWLVDPLDGTREFLKRNGEFTVNIALIEKEMPVLGVVYAPALALTFTARGPGTAARRKGAQDFQKIHARAVPEEGAVVVASRSHGDPKALDQFLAGTKVAGTMQAGSSLKFGLVAEGSADIYPRFGRTMEWDTAAGHAVLLAAGGSVETLDGQPLRYAKKGFENPSFVARGRRTQI